MMEFVETSKKIDLDKFYVVFISNKNKTVNRPQNFKLIDNIKLKLIIIIKVPIWCQKKCKSIEEPVIWVRKKSSTIDRIDNLNKG